MGTEISWEIREQAEELYIVAGRTFDQVAAHTGVSVSQLKRWAADGDWTERKREYRRAFSDIKRNTVLLRKKLIAKALQSLNPQDVYAVSSLENAAAKALTKEAPAVPDPVEKRIIKTPQDAIDALQDAIEKKLNAMLTRPDIINLAAVKETQQALALIDQMKVKHTAGTSDEIKSLSGEKIKQIREQLNL